MSDRFSLRSGLTPDVQWLPTTERWQRQFLALVPYGLTMIDHNDNMHMLGMVLRVRRNGVVDTLHGAHYITTDLIQDARVFSERLRMIAKRVESGVHRRLAEAGCAPLYRRRPSITPPSDLRSSPVPPEVAEAA